MSNENEIYVTRPALPPLEEYVDIISSIWETKWLTNNGPLHEKLREEIKNMFECEHLTLHTNGHMALDAAIRALDLKGEIITTPFTFVSTTHAITMSGCTPVFCDIKESDYTIDETKIEELITEKTVAILPVHVYGIPCNVSEIERIAKKYNLKVIYDAAHAFGVKHQGKDIATFGDISMFSFHATKVFNTVEGGALAFSDATLERKINHLRNFGIEGPEEIVDVGFNSKMHEFSAAMGLANLPYLDENIHKRKDIAMKYHSLLAEIPGITLLDFGKDNAENKPNYAYYPIQIDEKIYGKNRDELHKYLESKNIFTRKYFYPMITKSACYAPQYGDLKLPVTEYMSDRVLTLPIYPDLDMQDVKRIVREIEKYREI